MADISAEAKSQARQANLVQHLKNQGYGMKHEGSGNYRLKSHPSIIVKSNFWYDHRNQIGGNAVDFLVKIQGISFPDAIKRLVGLEPVTFTYQPPKCEPSKAENYVFKLPAESANNNRILQYLTEYRKIPPLIVEELIHRSLLYQDLCGNCVFVCSEQKAALLRGTNPNINWRGMAKGSDSSYPWVWSIGVDSKAIVVCESPIDCLSLYTLQPRKYAYIATNGLKDSALLWTIVTYRPKQIILALDNDEAGQTATIKWQKQLEMGQITVAIEKPSYKDWNETLIKSRL